MSKPVGGDGHRVVHAASYIWNNPLEGITVSNGHGCAYTNTWGVIVEVLPSDRHGYPPLGRNPEVQELVLLSLGSNGSRGF